MIKIGFEMFLSYIVHQ